MPQSSGEAALTLPVNAAALKVLRALERLKVRCYLCGSLASSVHGIPRLTNDADIVAELGPHHVGGLVRQLAGSFYVDEEAIAEAIRTQRSFNLIDEQEAVKVDVFCAGDDKYQEQAFGRTVRFALEEDDPFTEVPFASVEDTVVFKLHWFRLGGEVSERQWADVLGMLRLKRSLMDLEYARRWSKHFHVEDLLERALEAAKQP